jgi:microsomal dipeptidase-like Zn-dependent dipeptidase
VVPSLTEPETSSYEGYPSFDCWPNHKTVIHQQMYKDSIQNAFNFGLKLIVASAVNSELLADLYDNGNPIDTSDETSIVAQLTGMRAFAAQCSDWMQIVTSPAEARGVIEAGKLAVVLAIEVDSVCGGGFRRPDQLEPALVDAIVQKWFDMGVRLINPVHLVDNALGGTAIYDDRFNLSNHYLYRKYASQEPEPWWWNAVAASGDTADVRFLLGANTDNDLLINFYGQGYPGYMKELGLVGHVNGNSLSAAGLAFVTAMMKRGMLVDVEHMSSAMLNAMLDVAEARSYPLVSSHTGFRGLAVPRATGPDAPLYVRGCATEAMRTDSQLQRLQKLGSIVGIGGHVGFVQDLTIDASTGWARAYRYAQALGIDKIAIGTDMNGFATTPGPRFVRDPTSPSGYQALQPGDPARPLRYGIDLVPNVQKILQMAALGQTFTDYNVSGMTHYGTLPDFTLDVALQQDAGESLDMFFHSAEAFIEVWESCLSAAPA